MNVQLLNVYKTKKVKERSRVCLYIKDKKDDLFGFKNINIDYLAENCISEFSLFRSFYEIIW